MWSDTAVNLNMFAALPIATYRAGDTVLAAGSTTGLLLILREGAVAVFEEGIEIAKVATPGAVFGEISALLDCPHSANVRALEASQFHVASATALQDPAMLLYVATVLARRLEGANQALVELKSQIPVDQPRNVIERLTRLLGAGDLGFDAERPFNIALP